LAYKALFNCLEIAPLSNYINFELICSTDILAMDDYYVDKWRGAPHLAISLRKARKMKTPQIWRKRR
jgi:hypothetical protein